jgi:RimJ/RimL family protein N-acetyltransferase
MVRPLQESDADSLAYHANDRRIFSQLRDRFPHPYTQSDARTFIDFVRAGDPSVCFAIVVAGSCVGGIGLERQGDVNRIAAELGYWLGVEYWGRGIASEAIAAVSSWALYTQDLQRIFAQPYADNVASCRALEKAGFLLEATLRRSAIKEGVIRDQRMYARVR